jgi:hypothetical protein
MFDANADGSKVAYTPFDNSASFTELIAGVDINVAGGVSIIPNIIFVKYDKNDNGNTPDSDAYAKVTMYWKFN